jgi:nitroimidazol reductase NimA-like FMN-containing flavoprotein (pyridoxamine 5'-phosphate oxidase superfamily)
VALRTRVARPLTVRVDPEVSGDVVGVGALGKVAALVGHVIPVPEPVAGSPGYRGWSRSRTEGAMPQRADRVAEQLSSAECLDVLRRNDLGRLAVVLDDGQPDLFPVNYVVDGDRVIFRSPSGTKLDHAALAKVAFEVDERHADGAVSVVVKGVGREITTAMDPDSERQRELELLTPLEGDHWVRIVPGEITGRRLRGPGTTAT